MEGILRWSLANTDPDAPQPSGERLKALDPAIIDHILGKSDAVLMKEFAAKAADDKNSEDDRVEALGEFEMLVESIDNANNMTALKLWKPLIGLFNSTDSAEIRTQLLWIFGTAVQNNPKAQSDFLSHSPLLLIITCLNPSDCPDAETRSKAVYTLSGTLKHNRSAVEQFSEDRGWEVLRAALTDPSLAVRRKTAFMLSTLLLPSQLPSESSEAPAATTSQGQQTHFLNDPVPDPHSTDTIPATLAAFKSTPLLQTLLNELDNPTPHGPNGDGDLDPDLQEKMVRCIVHYIQAGGDVSEKDKGVLKSVVGKKKEFGFEEEWDVLEKASR